MIYTGMPYKIVWAVEAEEDLRLLLEYLSQNWNNKIALEYLDILEKNIQRIKNSPKLHVLINKELKIRKCVITEQNSLYYNFEENKITLLRIFDTRQNPDTLKF